MGTGEIFQEIVIATAADEQVQLVSYLDQNHRTSLTGNPLTLAIAAFVESPRDHFLNQEDKAASLALTLDGACDDLSAEALVCCVHHNRALHLEAQLSWFDQHLSGVTTSPAAVLLGVNPSAIAQSIACEAAGYPEWAQTLPQVTAHWANEWESTGVGSLALLLHTPPFVESAGYVQCTESWNPTEDCWKIEPNTDSINAHFTRLSEIARLSSWTDSSPYWSMLGGGYEGFGGTDLPSWTDLFPTIALPDSHPPKGLYFGLAGMNPLMNEVAAKDLAPTDTTKRAFPTELGPSPMEWDRDDGQGRGLYYPGQTFALPWLYESRRSGLLFVDFNTLSHPFIDWSSDQYPGQEGPTRIDYADAALELHYLITRNLAHRESSAGRWTYIHLHDLSSLSNPYFDAWATKGDPAKEETALHYLKENIDAWNDVITWKPTP
jgi:hypothetical protein